MTKGSTEGTGTEPFRRDEEFSEFVAGSARRLVHIARLTTGDPHRAEDLVQSALLGTYRHWDQVRERDPFAYTRRAVLNGHATWWRRVSQRELVLGSVPEVAAMDETVGIDSRDILTAALQELTPRERAVVVLRHVEDLSELQTAAELGIALGTVKSTSARALTKLRGAAALAPRTTGANP